MDLIIIYLIVAVVITSLIWMVYLTNLKSSYKNLNNNIENVVLVKSDEKINGLKDEISRLKTAILEEKSISFQEGFDKARSEISLIVHPFSDEILVGSDGFFINDIQHEVYVGYKCQLYINGLPILEPSTIILETFIKHKQKVDYNKIKTTLEIVENKILAIASTTNGLIKVTDTIVGKNNPKSVI